MLVREILKEKGISTKCLAEKLNMSVSGLNQHLSGNPSLKVLKAMAEALDVPMWRLFATPDQIEDESASDDMIVYMHHRGKDITPHSVDEVMAVLYNWKVRQFLNLCRYYTMQDLRSSYAENPRLQSLLDEVCAIIDAPSASAQP